MKRLELPGFAFLLASLLPASSHAAHKIVTFSQDVPMSEGTAGLEKLGCKVLRRLPLINAVAAEFPDETTDSDIMACRHVCELEEDRVIKWIEEAGDALPLSHVNAGLDGLKSGDISDAAAPVAVEQKAAVGRSELPWGVKRVNAAAAWDVTMGQGIRVGVIDTGIDYTHPDLISNYAGGYNAIDYSQPPLDDNGHGTHVAGIIGAARDGAGVVGVAPKASLYAVKVLDAKGRAPYSVIIEGMQWAVENKMNVINMSLGGADGSAALRKAVEAAYKSGVTIVVAAGNESSGLVNYPAAYPQAIAVAASDSADRIASFSSRGPEIDLIAPGAAVNSTYPGGTYKTASGTSMAAPHAAGLAALAIGAGAGTPAEVRRALRSAAVSIGLAPSEQGAGLVDAGKLVK